MRDETNKKEDKKMTIKKLRDKNFQGFICAECGRELKHAFSINGSGSYGSECVYGVAGISYDRAEKQIKEQMSLSKRWNKIVSNPKVYDLDFWVKEYGTMEKVEDVFLEYGNLR